MTQLDLTPGVERMYAHGCPACGALAAIETVGGDTIEINKTLDVEARGLMWITKNERPPRYALYAYLEVDRCTECQREFYRVTLALIANTEVSDDWADKYFWCSKQITGTPAQFTVTPQGGRAHLPKRWILARLETPAGWLHRHDFGPFLATEKATGWNGVVSRIVGGKMWTDAAALVARAWPLVNTL
jgi:hypothetical protein